tara:strand:+ start:166 stop:1242 length:1077 start_codon:yes stop_codon:yes gene_type:complete
MAYTTIDDPSAYFQTTLFVGNQTARSITFDGNTNMQPDLVWIKPRDNGTWSHNLTDSVRGAGKGIFSDLTTAEYDYGTGTDGSVRTFDSNGFSIGTATQVNNSSSNIVAWNWKAGTSFSNDASATGVGTLDSTASVSSTAGISILSFTGNATAGATVAHGIGAAPKFIMSKNRPQSVEGWQCYHASLGGTHRIMLDETGAALDNDTFWNDTNPTSSIITLGGNHGTNGSSHAMIHYCFTDVQGFSKFGSFVGNGSATDGVYIHLGFKAAWFMCKRTNASGHDWVIFNNKALGYNVDNNTLLANSSAAEGTADRMDILSNGVKMYNNNGSENESGGEYIFAAFAENPFVTSTGIPTTAR